MRINPGRPLKGSFGVVSDNRPFIAGDPDNLGYAHYGKLTHLEWGYISAVDDNRNNFEIGALVDLYGDLWAYGTENQKYLATLVGDTEADWTLKRKFQQAWALPRTTSNTANDVFTGSGDGVDSLYGIQEYGDVRTFSESDRVQDKIQDNWVSTAFSTYYPTDGQYWLYMPGYSKILICHTKHPEKPWTEYDPPITPTAFSKTGSFYIGSDDGHLYKLSDYKDLTTTQIYPQFRSAYVELPLDGDLTRIQFVAQSLSGTEMDLDIYKNGSDEVSVNTYAVSVAISGGLTVDELTMIVDDATFSLDPASVPKKIDLNIPCWSFQIGISNVSVSTNPVFFSGMFLNYSKVEI